MNIVWGMYEGGIIHSLGVACVLKLLAKGIEFLLLVWTKVSGMANRSAFTEQRYVPWTIIWVCLRIRGFALNTSAFLCNKVEGIQP